MNAAHLITGFLLYSMFRYIGCLESYWKECIPLRNYLPDSDSEFTTTIASNMFACMSLCLLTDGCCFISYIAVTSVCVRHRKMMGYQPRNFSSVWNIVKDDGCPRGWYRIERSCFYFAEVQLFWQDSVTYCQVLDARLAEVNSGPKDAFMRSVAITKTHVAKYWIGGSDSFQEGKWVWITSGSSMTNYTNWYIDQPDNTGANPNTADCVCVGSWRQFAAWDDCSCSEIASPLCEKPDINV